MTPQHVLVCVAISSIIVTGMRAPAHGIEPVRQTGWSRVPASGVLIAEAGDAGVGVGAGVGGVGAAAGVGVGVGAGGVGVGVGAGVGVGGVGAGVGAAAGVGGDGGVGAGVGAGVGVGDGAGVGAAAGVGAGGSAGAGASGDAGSGAPGGGPAGGDASASASSPADASSSWSEELRRVDDLVAELESAKADLASGAFAAAGSRAEAVLRAPGPPSVRATALVVAGDAAYAMRAYDTAARRYRELVSKHQVAPEAPRATLALGWAELRLGRREKARAVWTQLARLFPADSRVPTGLLLAAEVARQAGDVGGSRTLLDRIVERYAGSPDAELASLNRALLNMREGRTREAASDLRPLVRWSRSSVADVRTKLLDALLAAPVDAGPGPDLTLTNHYAAGTTASPDNGDPAGTGAETSFERFAAPFLDSSRDPEATLLVLHGLILVAAEDKAWPAAQALCTRMVDRFPGYQAAPVLLARVADRAVSDERWPIVRSVHEQMMAHYPEARSSKARIDFAEALYRTGAVTEARTRLTRFVEISPDTPDAPRALFLLAQANEALDQPREALAAYERMIRDYPHAEWTGESLLPHARLLQYVNGREEETRVLLEEIVRRSEGEKLAEASVRLARILSAEGEHARAVDRYVLGAQAVAEDSRWHRTALVGAGRGLERLNRTEEALALYRTALPSTATRRSPAGSVPDPELAGEAAYRAGEILFRTGDGEEALDMYLTAAHVAPKSPWGRRALVGAVRSFLKVGDRAAAEAVYRRLLGSSATEPALLAEARRALRPASDMSRRGR